MGKQTYTINYHMDNGRQIILEFEDTSVDGAFGQAVNIYNHGMEERMILIDKFGSYWMIIPEDITMIECRLENDPTVGKMLTDDWFREKIEHEEKQNDMRIWRRFE